MVQQSKKKSKKKIIIFSILAAVLAVLALLVVLGSKNEPVIPVQVEKVTSRTVTQTVLSTGKIYPEIQVLISPEVSGEIIELPVKEGMKVAKGDLLVRIKPDIYIAAKDRADAGLKSAQANLTQGESEYNRAKELFLKGLISESELEAAKTTYETRRAFYDQAKASVDQMAEDLRKTTVYAPMAGIVSGLQVELGERVLGTAQFQGTQVMTVADLSHMESRVDVGENDIVLISIGDTARIEVDAITDRKLTGIVYEIGNAAKTRGLGTQEEVTNFEVKIRIVDTEPRLRPGIGNSKQVSLKSLPHIIAASRNIRMAIDARVIPPFLAMPVTLSSATEKSDSNFPPTTFTSVSMPLILKSLSTILDDAALINAFKVDAVSSAFVTSPSASYPFSFMTFAALK